METIYITQKHIEDGFDIASMVEAKKAPKIRIAGPILNEMRSAKYLNYGEISCAMFRLSKHNSPVGRQNELPFPNSDMDTLRLAHKFFPDDKLIRAVLEIDNYTRTIIKKQKSELSDYKGMSEDLVLYRDELDDPEFVEERKKELAEKMRTHKKFYM